MTSISVLETGPSLSIQDLGRPGYLASGLGRGGAADRDALFEAATLLGKSTPVAAIEMAGFGGRFEICGGDCVIALTGAPMRARAEGRTLVWNATHLLKAGEVLEIGAATAGTYGYFSVAGGFDTPAFMGSQSSHLSAGIGRMFRAGDRVQLCGGNAQPGLRLNVGDRFNGGKLRALKSPQFEMFTSETVQALLDCELTRTPRGNRMGVELDGGRSFAAKGGLSVVSEMIAPGDIQMTGAGAPFILGPECQTTGGYPRIATIIPSDMARAMQAPPGAKFRIELVERNVGIDALHRDIAERKSRKATPMKRDPHDIADLLSYQLIDGVIKGEINEPDG